MGRHSPYARSLKGYGNRVYCQPVPGGNEHDRTGTHIPNADGITSAIANGCPTTVRFSRSSSSCTGLGEHSGRYRHVAEPLTDVGFACYGIDHLGHGNSGGTRAYIPDAQLAIDDLDQLCGIVSAEHPELPALLFRPQHGFADRVGIRAAVSQSSARCRDDRYSSSRRAQATRLAGVLMFEGGKLHPKIRLSPPGGPSILTADKDMLQNGGMIPWIDKGMWRVGTSAALIRLARDICANAHKLTPPLLIMHGEGDHLVPASRLGFFGETAGSTDVTLKLYPDLRHELVNEINRDEIINTLRNWLLDHVELRTARLLR